MILVIGGACQGKTAYVEEQFGKEYEIIDEYHLVVREQLLQEKEPLAEAERLLEEKRQSGQEEKLIIISNELGCGLVPVEAFERDYREASGRVNCYLAKRAEQVIRVICGIGSRIK